jgi:glycine cleavage system transcriptional repressor
MKTIQQPSHYLLWAFGPDQPGIVAFVTKKLFEIGCNLEDSTMMKLGSEFGIFLILTSNRSDLHLFEKKLISQGKKLKLTLGIKKIASKDARYVPVTDHLYSISVYGSDRPGIVFQVTQLIATFKFNVTDLTTHRTTGKNPGYILQIEGELRQKLKLKSLEQALTTLSKKLKTKIVIQPILAYPF